MTHPVYRYRYIYCKDYYGDDCSTSGTYVCEYDGAGAVFKETDDVADGQTFPLACAPTLNANLACPSELDLPDTDARGYIQIVDRLLPNGMSTLNDTYLTCSSVLNYVNGYANSNSVFLLLQIQLSNAYLLYI